MEKVIQRRANNGKEKHPKKENKYTQNPEEMLETDLKEEAVRWEGFKKEKTEEENS